MEGAGLAFSCIATGARFAAADPSELDGYVDETNKAIDLAGDLGAPYVRTFGGQAGGGELKGIVTRTADAYKRVVDHAAERNVTVDTGMLRLNEPWVSDADGLPLSAQVLNSAYAFTRASERAKTRSLTRRSLAVTPLVPPRWR